MNGKSKVGVAKGASRCERSSRPVVFTLVCMLLHAVAPHATPSRCHLCPSCFANRLLSDLPSVCHVRSGNRMVIDADVGALVPYKSNPASLPQTKPTPAMQARPAPQPARAVTSRPDGSVRGPGAGGRRRRPRHTGELRGREGHRQGLQGGQRAWQLPAWWTRELAR
jgi:hypothetical protein